MPFNRYEAFSQHNSYFALTLICSLKWGSHYRSFALIFASSIVWPLIVVSLPFLHCLKYVDFTLDSRYKSIFFPFLQIEATNMKGEYLYLNSIPFLVTVHSKAVQHGEELQFQVYIHKGLFNSATKVFLACWHRPQT